MFRSILGFAVLAILAWLGLKLIFGILGSLVGLAMTVLWLAFIVSSSISRCDSSARAPRIASGT